MFERVGPGQKLSIEQENALCQYLDRLDDIGTCAGYLMLAACANQILFQAHPNNGTLPPTVGPKWPEQFLQRHLNNQN